VSDLLQDLRYAARQLARTPGFTAAAIATLALGIGVNTIFFAAVNAMVFRPVRAARVDGLFVVELTDKLKRSRGPLTDAQFRRVEAEILLDRENRRPGLPEPASRRHHAWTRRACRSRSRVLRL
jgi:hypothetical protein